MVLSYHSWHALLLESYANLSVLGGSLPSEMQSCSHSRASLCSLPWFCWLTTNVSSVTAVCIILLVVALTLQHAFTKRMLCGKPCYNNAKCEIITKEMPLYDTMFHSFVASPTHWHLCLNFMHSEFLLFSHPLVLFSLKAPSFELQAILHGVLGEVWRPQGNQGNAVQTHRNVWNAKCPALNASNFRRVSHADSWHNFEPHGRRWKLSSWQHLSGSGILNQRTGELGSSVST